jgi:Na+-translocating ferredoxin:NAD+ oxidoreductase subunit G
MSGLRPDATGGGPGGGEGGRPSSRPLRLILTLGGAGALAGLLIVGVYQATLPAIEANRAAALAAAVEEVLGAPHAFQTLYLLDGALREDLPEGTDPRSVERAYPGYREDGSLIGFALEGAKPGFQDVIRVIFGYDPATGTVLGMRVLRHLETPGLGDRIVTDRDWVAQFEEATPPLVDVKPGEAREPHEVDMITGATISARTVMLAINEAVERWHPLLEGWDPSGMRPPADAARSRPSPEAPGSADGPHGEGP